jgi:hypothetical protein
LAGGCPQPAAASTSRFGFLLPKPVGTRTAIWRQKLCTSKADKAIDLQNFSTKLIGLTRLVRRASEHVTARS